MNCFPKRVVNFIYHHNRARWGIPKVTDILDWIPYLWCRFLSQLLDRKDIVY